MNKGNRQIMTTFNKNEEPLEYYIIYLYPSLNPFLLMCQLLELSLPMFFEAIQNCNIRICVWFLKLLDHEAQLRFCQQPEKLIIVSSSLFQNKTIIDEKYHG